MGGFDSMKDQAGEMLGEHGDQAEEGVNRAAEFADEKSGGQYGEQIDTGTEKASEGLSSFGQGGERQDSERQDSEGQGQGGEGQAESGGGYGQGNT